MTQWITIVMIAGLAGDVIARRFREWSAARQPHDSDEWSVDQWPEEVRMKMDAFIDQLLQRVSAPPVLYFDRWIDRWSMFDIFHQWLLPPDGLPLLLVHTDRFEVYGYALPDGGRLVQHLETAGPLQFAEDALFVKRLRGAVEAWKLLVDQSFVVVIREVLGQCVTDDEIRASLKRVPDWLSEYSSDDT